MDPDPFDLLEVERRPWLELDAVEARFHALAKALHPDAPHGNARAFASLNEARDTLLDPARRLLALCEKGDSTSGRPTIGPSGAFSEMAFQIGPVLRAATNLIQEVGKANHLQRAILATRLIETDRNLSSQLDSIAHQISGLIERTLELDRNWNKAHDINAARLLGQDWMQATKWQQQIRESRFAIRQTLATIKTADR